MVRDDRQRQSQAETLADLRGLRGHYHAAKQQLARARIVIPVTGMVVLAGGTVVHAIASERASVWSLAVWPLTVCVGMGFALFVVFLVVRSRLLAEVETVGRQAGAAGLTLADLARSDPEMSRDTAFLRLLEQDPARSAAAKPDSRGG